MDYANELDASEENWRLHVGTSLGLAQSGGEQRTREVIKTEAGTR